MKIFVWENAILKLPKIGEDYNILLWVHDEEMCISYVWPSIFYWNGDNWVSHDSEEIFTPDLLIVNWCYVPKSRNGLFIQRNK